MWIFRCKFKVRKSKGKEMHSSSGALATLHVLSSQVGAATMAEHTDKEHSPVWPVLQMALL